MTAASITLGVFIGIALVLLLEWWLRATTKTQARRSRLRPRCNTTIFGSGAGVSWGEDD